MPRRNFLLILSYDGTGFEGWQRLPGGARTVQGTVEAALSSVLGEPLEIVGAGRTDKGVHAEGQAASFHSRTALDCEALLTELRAILPSDLKACSLREVDPRFHARFRVKSKVYRYRLHVGPRPDPLLHPLSHHLAGPLDLEAMRAVAAKLEGEHDFAAFTNAKEGETRRRLDRITIKASVLPDDRGGLVDLLFEAKGFLYNQVRIMAGTLVEAGRGKIKPTDIERLLSGRERAKAPGSLGPHGLTLVEVKY